MLEITIPGGEKFNEETMEFIETKDTTIQLEHSLLSLSKWESKWHKPFISRKKGDKTAEELIDYIRCMTLTKNVDPMIYYNISPEIIEQIQDYINDPMSATTITDRSGKQNREIMTAEVIYYYMVALNIPFECQKWHLNKLMTLISVCSIKNQPNNKKMSRSEILARNRELNEMRRKKWNTKG